MTAGDGPAGEQAVVFACGDAELPGVIHPGDDAARLGVVVVVGGPQYRVGSHRQFVLLARALADAGVPVMRFDYRGMGDAGGEVVGFEGIDHDIAAAIAAFREHRPAIERVVLWGLCDAASAALFYAWRDERVAGVVLLNPWVRTEQGEAQAYLNDYYRARFLSVATWRRIVSGEVNLLASARSLLGLVRRRFRGGDPGDGVSLPERMLAGLQRFRGEVLVVLSGQDLTAAEFRNTVEASSAWQRALAGQRVRRHELAHANHTFSSRADRDAVARLTREWLQERFP